MKAFLLCLLLASGPALAQTESPLSTAIDKKYGFRDLRFGADTTELAGRRFVMRGNNITYYTRPADSPLVGGCEVRIMYGFFRGKLLNVTLTTTGMGTGNALLYALKKAYGVPAHDAARLERYRWDGYQVMAHLTLNETNQAEAIIVNRAMLNQIEAENIAKAKQPAGGL